MKNIFISALCCLGFQILMAQNYVVNPSNWSQIGLSGDTVQAIAANDNYVVAGTRRGVFLSLDFGQSWMSFNKGLNDTVITALFIDTSGIYVGTSNGNVFRIPSADTSINWNFVINDFMHNPQYPSESVSEIKRSGSNLIFNVCCSRCNNYISVDNGSTWSQNVIGDACHVQKAGYKNYLVAGGFFGPFLSYNNGVSWNKLQGGISWTGDFSIAGVVSNDFTVGFYYNDAGYLYYNSKSSGTNLLKNYYGEFDTAYHWEIRGVSVADRFAADPDPSKLWGIGNDKLYLLNLGGYVWPQYTSPNSNRFLSVAANSNFVFIGQEGGGVIRGLKSCGITTFFEIRPANPNDSSGIYNAYNMGASAPGITYLWDFGDGTTSTQQFPSHTYANAGSYIICLTVMDGVNCLFSYCDSTLYKAFKTDGYGALKQLNVMAPVHTGIPETGAKDLDIYPNPTEGLVGLDFAPGVFNKMKLYNLEGQLLMDTKPSVELNLYSLPKGLYLLRMEGEGFSASRRILLK